MLFDTLPTEIITGVFLCLPSVSSAVALSSTCHRYRNVYHSSKKLVILNQAAEAEFGPTDDIVQVVTRNASQPAHIRRSVPLSDALLRQVVQVGRVAQRWEGLYPFKKWKADYSSRRLLTNEERYRVRRAIYRLWLYSKAFHNPLHVRTCRGLTEFIRERAALLQNFSPSELAEMLDVHLVLKDTVSNNVCPSNGKIRQGFQKRHPDGNSNHLLFNTHFSHPQACAPSSFVPDGWFHNSDFGSSKYHSRLQPSRWHEPAAEGWGDDISHYYVVEDMTKLDPQQVLFLRDQCPLKWQVEAFVKDLGEWFANNGETFSETLAAVLRQRGADYEAVKAAVENFEVGVAVVEEASW